MKTAYEATAFVLAIGLFMACEASSDVFEAKFEENTQLNGWTQVGSPWTVIDDEESEHYGAVRNNKRLAALYNDDFPLPESFKISFEVYPTSVSNDGMFVMFNVEDSSAGWGSQHQFNIRWRWLDDEQTYFLRYRKAGIVEEGERIYDQYGTGNNMPPIEPGKYTPVSVAVKDGVVIFKAGEYESVMGNVPYPARDEEDDKITWYFAGNIPIEHGHPGTKFGFMVLPDADDENEVYIRNVKVEPLPDDYEIAAPPIPERKMFDFPAINHDGKVYEIVRSDFHLHTTNSDGSVLPDRRVLEAWEYGFDAIAITDHGNHQPRLETQWRNSYADGISMAEPLGIILLRGLETGLTRDGEPVRGEHLVAVGFTEDYYEESRDEHAWAETEDQDEVFYQDQWERLIDAGAYVFYAHPHLGFREQMQWGYEQGYLHGMEVYNHIVGPAWNPVESHGTRWYPEHFDLALEKNMAVFANSDAHPVRGDPDEEPATLVLVKDNSAEGILEALHSGYTVAHFNDMFCARQELLEMLARNFIEINIEETYQGHQLEIINLNPLKLVIRIEELSQDVTLEGHETVHVELEHDSLRGYVTLTWKNFWVNSSENLVTRHEVNSLGVLLVGSSDDL